MPVTCAEMRELEAAALAAGQTEDALMEEAGAALAAILLALCSQPAAAVIFAGKGHNAGDAFVVARHLREHGWPVVVRAAFPQENWRPLTLKKYRVIADRLSPELPTSGPLLLIDGLLGLGTGGGALRQPILESCRELNALRLVRHATTVALDGPSGLDFDTGKAEAEAVVADLTITVAEAKTGLLAEAALNHVGRLAVARVEALERPVPNDGADGIVLTPRVLRGWLPPRRAFDFHKGEAGRVLVVAGSRGYLGAARLCAAAAVHGGAGLVTLAVPVEMQDAAAASVIPEVMVRDYREFDELGEFNGGGGVLAVGPGLGNSIDHTALIGWLAHEPRPAVMDAETLNALAATGLTRRPGPGSTERLLTPHPGEMTRLLAAWKPELATAPRREQARTLAEAFGVTLLLKGSRTLIATPGPLLAHNTTGHPGMASGGMGDVLTGLCAALMAQGCAAHHAACLGSWLLGRAAELALFSGAESPESLRASTVLAQLGPAFDALRFSDA